MITARGRIHLDDLEPIAPPLEPNAVVVAERFGRSGDELYQLDLRDHQRVKGAQLHDGLAGDRHIGLEQYRAKMLRDRPPNAVIGVPSLSMQ